MNALDIQVSVKQWFEEKRKEREAKRIQEARNYNAGLRALKAYDGHLKLSDFKTCGNCQNVLVAVAATTIMNLSEGKPPEIQWLHLKRTIGYLSPSDLMPVEECPTMTAKVI